MKFAKELNAGSYAIVGYAEGEITVAVPPGTRDTAKDGKLRLTESFIVGEGTLITDWPPEDIDQLRSEHLDAVAEMAPDVVILGAGPQLRFPHPSQLAPLMEHGIGFEVMDTRAACRTYNVLIGEGRRVVAALMMP